MKLGPLVEKVPHPRRGRRWFVSVPYPASQPYRDPDRPDTLILPLTGRGGWTRTRWGGYRLARRLERQIAREAGA